MQRHGPGPKLPSIRTLHPNLPPPLPAPGPYPSPSTNPVVSSNAPPTSSYAGSDPERDAEPELDTEEPPKKKRRRQALSCTECKRRKIRCDRKQPCEPCMKRGDTDKCQWHVVEPATEKYVPRAEHDALLARVAALETYLQRIPSPALGVLPAFSPAYGNNSNSARFSTLNPPNTVNPSHLGHGNTFGFHPSDSPPPPPMHGLMSFPPQRTSPPQTLVSTSTSQTPQQHARPRTSSSASFSQSQMRSIPSHDMLASPSTDQMQTQHRDQQLRRASFSQSQLQHVQSRPSSSFSQPKTRSSSPHQTRLPPQQPRRSPPQIFALQPPSSSTLTQQQPQPQRRSPPDLTPTSTSHYWPVGGSGGFGVFPAASGVSGSGSASYFSVPSGSGSASGVAHVPPTSGSFSAFAASSVPTPGAGLGSTRTHSFPFPSPRFTSASASSISSSASSVSGGSASSFTSGGSATPAPVFSTPAFTVSARDKWSAGEMTRDSPLLLASAATANTSVGGPEAQAPKNQPAQAPQGARLRVGCAPWALEVVVMRMELEMPMRPRMVGAGGKVSRRIETSARTGVVIGREGKVEIEARKEVERAAHICSWMLTCTPRRCCTRARMRHRGPSICSSARRHPTSSTRRAPTIRPRIISLSITRRRTSTARCLLTPIARPHLPANGTVRAHAQTPPRSPRA